MTVLAVIFTKCDFMICFSQPRSQRPSTPLVENKTEKKQFEKEMPSNIPKQKEKEKKSI